MPRLSAPRSPGEARGFEGRRERSALGRHLADLQSGSASQPARVALRAQIADPA